MNEAFVSYEELWRSRRVLPSRRITPSKISIILHMIQKPNSIKIIDFGFMEGINNNNKELF